MSNSLALNIYEDRSAQLDPDSFLGYVTFFSCSDADVKHADVKKLLDDVGLGHLVPRPPADSDVFRRIVWQGTHRKYEGATADMPAEVLLVRHISDVSPTKDTPGKIVRFVVSEFVARKQLTLDYPEHGGGDLVFSHATGELEVRPKADASPAALQLLDDLAKQYRRTRQCLDGNALRRVIDTALSVSQAVPLRGRSGGVFFVPSSYSPTLEALKAWAHALREQLDVGIEFRTIPLVNTPEQSEMILSCTQEAIAKEAQDLRDELMAELENKEGKITMRRFSSINSRYKMLQGKTAEYEQLLKGVELTNSTQLNIVSLQVRALFTRVV